MIAAAVPLIAAVLGLVIGFFWGCHYTVTVLEQSRAFDREYKSAPGTTPLTRGTEKVKP